MVLVYDARAEQLSLTVVSEVASLLEFEGAAHLTVWFEEHGTERTATAWGRKLFYYSKSHEGFEFDTQLGSGEPARTFLEAFANNSSFGLSYKGEKILNVPLAGSAMAIADLRDCAAEQANLVSDNADAHLSPIREPNPQTPESLPSRW